MSNIRALSLYLDHAGLKENVRYLEGLGFTYTKSSLTSSEYFDGSEVGKYTIFTLPESVRSSSRLTHMLRVAMDIGRIHYSGINGVLDVWFLGDDALDLVLWQIRTPMFSIN